MNKLLTTVIVVIALSNLTEVASLRCYHCVSAKVMSSENIESHQDTFPLPPSFPLNHPSCDYRTEPDADLSINCETEAQNVAASLEVFSKEFGEFESKIRDLARSARGARFACTTMEFKHPVNFNGTEMHMDITYRSCYPAHRNFTADLKDFNIDITRGYSCHSWNNCNGKEFHLADYYKKRFAYQKSSESDVAGFSSILLLFLLPILLQLF